MKKNRHIYGLSLPLLVLSLGMLAMLMLAATERTGQNQRQNSILMSAVMDIQIEVSVFHLWIEEALSGGKVNLNDAWQSLNHASGLATKLLGGGETTHGIIEKPFSDPIARERAERLESLLVELGDIGYERLKYFDSAGIGTPIDERFDAIFKDTLHNAKAIELIMLDRTARYDKHSLRLFWGILSSWAVLLTLASIGLIRLERRRRHAEKALTESRAGYKDLYEFAPDMFATVEVGSGIIRQCNRAFADKLGYSTDELVDRPVLSLYHEDSLDEARKAICDFAKSGGVNNVELQMKKRNGCKIFTILNNSAIRDKEGNIAYSRSVWRDITEIRLLMDELERLATRDTLTRAFNRTKFHELIDMEIERSRRFSHPLSIIIFDLDNFKEINDSFGHQEGDRVLSATADIVREHIRKANHFVRWGGEEFVIIAVETDIHGALHLSERIRKALRDYKFDGIGTVTASFGVALLIDDDTEETIIKKADDALYRAKGGGRDRVEVF